MKKLFTSIRQGKLNELLSHGADIYDYFPCRENGLLITFCLIRNLEEGRELMDGFYGLDPDSDAFKPYTIRCRGKERIVQPSLLQYIYGLRHGSQPCLFPHRCQSC